MLTSYSRRIQAFLSIVYVGDTMTPEERAEKIINSFAPPQLADRKYWTQADRSLAIIIAAQIREAVDERDEEISRLRSALKDHNKAIQTSMLEEAKAEAYEEAAKYLEIQASLIRGDWNGPDILNRMAHEIRALKDKLK